MRREHRLSSGRDFDRTLGEGSAVARPGFVLYHSRRDGQRRSRFGFVVSRRIGGAVVRNRIKRLLREACRPLIPRIRPDVDVVVVARKPILEMSWPELREAVEEAAEEAGFVQTEEGTST